VLTKLDKNYNEPFIGNYRQEIDYKISYVRKNDVSLGWIKRKFGTKFYNRFECLQKFPLETKLKWLRDHYPIEFYYIMTKGVGDKLLDYRIEKNKNNNKKRAIYLRDNNYKTLFGVARALELHPCCFDQM
jgi:hypothetical protein